MTVLSIITVVKNDKAALLKTYESIKDILGETVEYVVQDCKGESQLGDVPNLILSEETDTGTSDAVNIAVKNARGKYLIFWGAGETAIRPAFDFAVDYISSHSSIDILFNPALIPETGQILTPAPQTVDTGMACVTPGAMISRDLFWRCGGLDLTYKIANDYAMFAKMLKMTKNYAALNVPIANFSLGGMSSVKEYEGWLECELIRIREFGKHPLLSALDLASLCTAYVRSKIQKIQ